MKQTSPTERSLRSRIAAHSRWAREDPVQGTFAARSKFLNNFIDKVDPERKLAEPERLRRAESARRAHFLELALRSAQVRRTRKSQANPSSVHPKSDSRATSDVQ